MGVVVLLPGHVVKMATRVLVQGTNVEVHLVGGGMLQFQTPDPDKFRGPGALQRIDLRNVAVQQSHPRNRAPR